MLGINFTLPQPLPSREGSCEAVINRLSKFLKSAHIPVDDGCFWLPSPGGRD